MTLYFPQGLFIIKTVKLPSGQTCDIMNFQKKLKIDSESLTNKARRNQLS